MIARAALASGAVAAAVATAAAVAAPPLLGVSPPTAPVGVTVQVSASTAPGVDYHSCTVSVVSVPVATCTLDANGELRASFPVPTPLVAGTSYPVTVCAGVCGGHVAVRSKGTFVAMGWLMVPTPALSPPPTARPHSTVLLKGTGWSVPGKCSVSAPNVTAARCSIDPAGGLHAKLVVQVGTRGGRYPVKAINALGTSTQTADTTLTVATVAPPTSTSPSSVPAVTASNTTRWPLSGPATGGLAVLLLVLMGATGALIRWHPRPRTIPVIQVRLTTQPGYFPQLAGDRNSRIHAIHWQLRTEGPTMDGPRP